MATSKKLREQINDITECSICSESFKEPKVLPCIHTFCLHCLEKYGKEKEKEPGKKVDCPLCRKLFEIPQAGFKGLPNNYFIIQLLQISLQQDGTGGTMKKDVHCELCSSVSQVSRAVAYCIERGQDLCELCTSKHKLQRFTKTHKFLNLDEKPAAEDRLKMMPSYCEKHPSKEIELYCYDCNKAFCLVCGYVDKHNTHKFYEVEKSAVEFRAKLGEDIIKLGLAKSQDEMKQLDEERSKFITKVQETGREIVATYNRLRDMLDKHQKELMKELKSYEVRHLKEIQMRKDEVETMLVTIEGFRKYCTEIKNKGTPCEISRVAKDLHSRTEELVKAEEELIGNQMPSAGIILIPSTPLKETAKNWIGELSYDIKTLNSEEVFSSAVFLTQPTIHQVIHSKTLDLRGIAVVGNEMFLGGESSAYIDVYDTKTLTLTRQIPIPGLAKARAIAACSHHNSLYVGTADAKAILHRFDLSNNSMSRWSLNGWCHGLSISRSFSLIVTLFNKRIQEFTTHGSLIREIIIKGGNPYHCVQLSSGEFVVAGNDHTVCVVSSTGHVLNLYGGPAGLGNGQLKCPYQLSVDKSDNVIVADYGNSRIVILSPTLTLLGYIPTPGIKQVAKLDKTWPVHLDALEGYLYIGECHSGRVLVLKARAIKRPPFRNSVFVHAPGAYLESAAQEQGMAKLARP